MKKLKKSKTFRLSTKTLERIEQLTYVSEFDQTKVVEHAIKKWYDDLFGKHGNV